MLTQARNIYNVYGFIGICRLIKDWVMTQIFYRGSRLVRFPFYIRGRKFISIGLNFTTGVSCRFDAFIVGTNKPKLIIGDNVQINDYVHIGCIESIEIGNDVLIASKVFITDHNHGDLNNITDFKLPPSKRLLTSKKVVIGSNCWLGEGVIVLPGVTIGQGSIIGAGSIVTKSIPDFSVVVGNPAKVIRYFDVENNHWIKCK